MKAWGHETRAALHPLLGVARDQRVLLARLDLEPDDLGEQAVFGDTRHSMSSVRAGLLQTAAG